MSTQQMQTAGRDWDAGSLKQIIADALAHARTQGATSAEASVSADAGLSVTARMGEAETVEFHRDHGLSVTVYRGTRKGSASTSDLSPSSIADAVAAACGIAEFTAEDPCAGLADAALMANHLPDLDLDHPWDLKPEQAIELAIACEDAARGADPRIINSEGASVSSVRGLFVYGNTHGFLGAYPSTRHSISCSVVSGQDDAMQRDYWYSTTRLATALESPQSIGLKAAQRAVSRLGARRIPTGKYPVLFESDVARSLIGHFVSAIRGGALYRKASFLLGELDKPVFPSFVRIHEQPLLPRALGSSSFDQEGVATQTRDLVSDGVLRGYLLGSYAGRKLGLASTGNAGGVHNLQVEPGTQDLQALMTSMGRGLLVTELIGHGINLVTGDYSRGAAGFWVENGQIQHAVEEITIAGNLRDMFRELSALGSDIDLRGNVRCPSILISQLTVAGE